MKVVITGANGFVGKSVANFLKKDQSFDVVALGKNELNLLNAGNVEHVLSSNCPDIVVHCAIKGGTKFDKDTIDTYNDNIKMYQNLKNQRSKFGCLINIGSGAEFDRLQNINNNDESLLFERLPSDFYGKAKNEIAKDVVLTDDFYNLRIFGCFGIFENENRFLKIAFSKNEKSESIEIDDDKEMDFVHVDDLAKVISFISKNHKSQKIPKDINVTYFEKFLLSEIINLFIPEGERKLKIKVKSRSKLDYSGSSSRICSIENLNFSAFNLKNALSMYYNQLKEV
jgi:UDP-glucose 4-epimerase